MFAQDLTGMTINARFADQYFLPNLAWSKSWWEDPILKNQIYTWTTDPSWLPPRKLPPRAFYPIFLDASTPYIPESQRRCWEEGNLLPCGTVRNKLTKVYKIIPFSGPYLRGAFQFDASAKRALIYSHIAICVDAPTPPVLMNPGNPANPGRPTGINGPNTGPACGLPWTGPCGNEPRPPRPKPPAKRRKPYCNRFSCFCCIN